MAFTVNQSGQDAEAHLHGCCPLPLDGSELQLLLAAEIGLGVAFIGLQVADVPDLLRPIKRRLAWLTRGWI